MDHKKFLQELQKRSGLDKNRLTVLLKTTEEVIRNQAINLNPVDIKGLGCFEPRKRLEFVHQDPKTGRTVMYPPRIVVHFTPDDSVHFVNQKETSHE